MSFERSKSAISWSCLIRTLPALIVPIQLRHFWWVTAPNPSPPNILIKFLFQLKLWFRLARFREIDAFAPSRRGAYSWKCDATGIYGKPCERRNSLKSSSWLLLTVVIHYVIFLCLWLWKYCQAGYVILINVGFIWQKAISNVLRESQLEESKRRMSFRRFCWFTKWSFKFCCWF